LAPRLFETMEWSPSSPPRPDVAVANERTEADMTRGQGRDGVMTPNKSGCYVELTSSFRVRPIFSAHLKTRSFPSGAHSRGVRRHFASLCDAARPPQAPAHRQRRAG
jgi:hypothetical protein